MKTCQSCTAKGIRPGDCHIYCQKAFNPGGSPLAEIFAILGGVGRAMPPLPAKQCPFKPQMKTWPGCGSWPSNFDPNIVKACEGWEPRVE